MSVNKINKESFKEVIKGKKVLVDCYADWCGPCRMLGPIVDEISEEVKDCDFYKLNVDDDEEVARDYGIMTIPTLLLFEDGKLVDKSIGLRTKDELIEFIKK